MSKSRVYHVNVQTCDISSIIDTRVMRTMRTDQSKVTHARTES